MTRGLQPWFSSMSVLFIALAGCAEPTVTSHPALVNPGATSWDSGGTDDISEATQRAIASLVESPGVRSQPGNRVVLNNIVNKTGIPDYDEKIIYNRFLSDLINKAAGKLVFLNRGAVSAERERQLRGEVKTSGVPAATAGADMVLDIELRQLRGAGSKTIQYTFSLTNLEGIIVWTDSYEIKKRA